MTEEEPKEKIVWIGGYPHIEGVNTPRPEHSLEGELIGDILFEAEQRSKGVKGWALVQAFIDRLKEEYGGSSQ